MSDLVFEEVKGKWLAALRSGEYRQGEGQLRSEDGGYCCLGVLCDVIDPEGWGRDDGEWEWENHLSMLTAEICELMGLTDDGYFSTAVEGRHSLVALNDSGEYSFGRIADIIEEKYKQGDFYE